MSNKHPLRVALVMLQIVCWLAVIWPGALLANRIRPFVLGLPFMYFWYIAWILVMTVGLFLLYHLEYRGSGE